jgi:hypothetical protein
VQQVAAAVSALTRRVDDALYQHGPTRTLFIQALVACTQLSKRRIAAELGMSHSSIVATPPLPSATLATLERVLGDPRFPALQSRDLTDSHAWQAYCQGRERRGAHTRLVQSSARQLRRRRKDKRPPHLLGLI